MKKLITLGGFAVVFVLFLTCCLNSQIFLDVRDSLWGHSSNQPVIDPKTRVDFLKTDHVDYFGPAIQVIENRMIKIDQVMDKRGFLARHISSYAYGSCFLQHTQVGNDLDYGSVVDIGTIYVRMDNLKQAAGIMLQRVEEYLGVTRELFYEENSPELTGIGFHKYIDNQGRFIDRDILKASLTEQLAKILNNQANRKIIDSKYLGHVPLSLSTNELRLDRKLQLRYYSNKVQFSEEMLPGIREITVAYDFIFTFEVINENKLLQSLNGILYPVYLGSGRVNDVRNNLFLDVWINGEHYQNYVKRVFSAGPQEYIKLLHQFGGFFSMLATEELARGRYIKTIKRIHQAYDALKIYLPDKDRQNIGHKLQKWLSGPAATILETFKEESEILGDLTSQPDVFRMYLANGDVQKILRYFNKSISELQDRYDSQACIELARYVTSLSGKDVTVLTADDFQILHDLAVKLQNEILPDSTEFEAAIETIQGVLLKLDYLLVRIEGRSGEDLLVNIYDLKNEYSEVPSINYLKERGIPVFENVKYNLQLRKKIDTKQYSRNYWLSP